MKIFQTSNIYLGRRYEDNSAAGDRLRAGIKSLFANIIDTARDDKADLVILAGNIFDNLDLSQNLFDSFVSEIGRLEEVPVILFPGRNDPYRAGSIWDYWRLMQPSKNLFLLAGKKPMQIDFPKLSLTVYGIPYNSHRSLGHKLGMLKKNKTSQYHIAVTNGGEAGDKKDPDKGISFDPAPFAEFGFNYVAVGDLDGFTDLGNSNVKALSSGSPLVLTPGGQASGVLLINIEKDSFSTELKKVQGFEWKAVEISMDSIHNPDELKNRVLEYSGQYNLLRVELSGLTLLETDLNIEYIKKELEEHFLDLQFVDNTRVLPENISEVKVQEKTVLGQYLKVMVKRLNSAGEKEREKLEKSLKIGYSLLSGRAVW